MDSPTWVSIVEMSERVSCSTSSLSSADNSNNYIRQTVVDNVVYIRLTIMLGCRVEVHHRRTNVSMPIFECTNQQMYIISKFQNVKQ